MHVVAVAAVAVAAAGVSAEAVAVAAAAEVSAAAAGVPAEAVVEVSTGDLQVVVHREEEVMGVSGTQAAGLPLPEALAGAAAVVATIAQAGPERGTGAAFRGRKPGVVAHGRKLEAVVRILEERSKAVDRIPAERSKAGDRILAERSKAGDRIHGQSGRTHAQIVATSVAMM